VERGTARLVALALVVAGAARFAAELGTVEDRYAELALLGLALVVLLHLTLTVDPAWLLSAGIVSTMFAGNWHLLGLNASVGPHRVLLGAALLALLLRAPPARDRPPLQLDGVHFVLAAALAYALISAILVGSLDEDNAQFVLLDQFGLLPFLIFTVGPVAFATDRQRMILLGSVVAVGAYLSVTALLEKLELYDLVVPSYIGDPAVGQHFGRARGPFVEAAADGLALYACAVAAAMAFVLWQRPWPRALAAGVAVLAPVGVLLTVTRGVWLAAIIATLVTLAVHAPLRRLLIPVTAAGVAGVLLSFTLIPGLAGDAERRQRDKAPIYERQNTNAAGLRMVADRPFLGFGWDRAYNEIEPYFRQHPDIPLTGRGAGLHNTYLQYAVSLGIVGAGLWALGLALAFGRAVTGRASPRLVPWKLGLTAFFIAWFVVGLFSPAHYAFTAYLVWAWAGVAYRSPVRLRAVGPVPQSTNGRPVAPPRVRPSVT
jgi:O-antigen ligase